MIRAEISDAELNAWLDRLRDFAHDPSPALLEIGEELVDSTLRRFVDSVAPDGSHWAPNSLLTIMRSGQGNAKKPLIGAGKALSTQINYAVSGDSVTIGSPMKYAAVQQHGARMGEFGRYYQLFRRQYAEDDFRRHAGSQKGHPIPWANIPARPFLGVSKRDRDMIERIVADYITPD